MAVTPADIAVALGVPAPEGGTPTYEQWQMWIDDAYMLIEARLGDLTKLDQAKLDYVVREAVVAQVRHPEDSTQVAVSVDDGSVSKSYRTSPGTVHIRDDWWELLSPSAGKKGAFSVIPSGRGADGHLPWCSLSMGANFCSCGTDLAGHPIYGIGVGLDPP